jgi:hypothetical protein
VKLRRLSDYDGIYKVEVIVPANAKGLTFQNTVIKAGADEAKLTVNAQKAQVGSYTVAVRVTAMFNDTLPIVHEAKLTVNVGK